MKKVFMAVMFLLVMITLGVNIENDKLSLNVSYGWDTLDEGINYRTYGIVISNNFNDFSKDILKVIDENSTYSKKELKNKLSDKFTPIMFTVLLKEKTDVYVDKFYNSKIIFRSNKFIWFDNSLQEVMHPFSAFLSIEPPINFLYKTFVLFPNEYFNNITIDFYYNNIPNINLKDSSNYFEEYKELLENELERINNLIETENE
ncbi:hypothetical protein [Geotoga petraea]|jgi:hypothetical protein|uniref:Uncharacterized protein n=1 Tax=Geotoga petraea TaxID=28234 RepID=A0A1G6LPQ5_9BACT|nr:hypothetical protein [Geotoga petraea]SDC45067.1 hypothetical protein SAMN04488588_1102 [Geotoga petraea]